VSQVDTEVLRKTFYDPHFQAAERFQSAYTRVVACVKAMPKRDFDVSYEDPTNPGAVATITQKEALHSFCLAVRIVPSTAPESVGLKLTTWLPGDPDEVDASDVNTVMAHIATSVVHKTFSCHWNAQPSATDLADPTDDQMKATRSSVLRQIATNQRIPRNQGKEDRKLRFDWVLQLPVSSATRITSYTQPSALLRQHDALAKRPFVDALVPRLANSRGITREEIKTDGGAHAAADRAMKAIVRGIVMIFQELNIKLVSIVPLVSDDPATVRVELALNIGSPPPIDPILVDVNDDQMPFSAFVTASNREIVQLRGLQ
jgi:hypothetical protein